jgi:hypothetical protein
MSGAIKSIKHLSKDLGINEDTPELTPTVTLTPKITQTISPTSIAVSYAEQKTITNSIGMEFVLITAGVFDMVRHQMRQAGIMTKVQSTVLKFQMLFT